jgi:hypothetical protein
MKKFYIFLVALFMAFSVSGQTYLSEDFGSGEMPPEGWSIFAFTEQFVCAP